MKNRTSDIHFMDNCTQTQLTQKVMSMSSYFFLLFQSREHG